MTARTYTTAARLLADMAKAVEKGDLIPFDGPIVTALCDLCDTGESELHGFDIRKVAGQYHAEKDCYVNVSDTAFDAIHAVIYAKENQFNWPTHVPGWKRAAGWAA